MELALAILGTILGVSSFFLSVYNTIQIKAASVDRSEAPVVVDPMDNVRAIERGESNVHNTAIDIDDTSPEELEEMLG